MIWVRSAIKQTNTIQQLFKINDHLVKQGLPNFTGHKVENHVSRIRPLFSSAFAIIILCIVKKIK